MQKSKYPEDLIEQMRLDTGRSRGQIVADLKMLEDDGRMRFDDDGSIWVTGADVRVYPGSAEVRV